MRWQVGLYLVPLIVATGLSVAVAVFVWRRRSAPGATPLALLMVAIAFWTLAYLLEVASADLAGKAFWVRVEYPGIVSVPVFWLLFCAEYTNRERWLTRGRIAALAVVPLITVGLAATNEAHHLIWRSLALDTHGPFALLDVTYGAWFWVHVTTSYALLAGGVILLIQALFRLPPTYHPQVGIVLAGASIPWVGNVLHVLDISPYPNLDPTSFAFTLSGLVIAWGMFRFQLLDLLPVAYDAVIEGIQDGVIVLDLYDRVVDLNPAAERMVGRRTRRVTGQPVDEVVPGLPDRTERPRGVGEMEGETVLGEGEAKCLCHFHISPLFDRQKRRTGRLITLRDVTEQKRAQRELYRREAILQAVSFAAERFLTTPSWEACIHDVLERLGQAAEVSRAYVFENHVTEDGILLTSQRYEWLAPGIASAAGPMESSNLQDIPMRAAGFERWESTLSHGGVIHGHVRQFPTAEYAFLSAQSILSIAIVPVFVEGWWGFVGFDECVSEREWSAAEMDALKAAANTLGAAIQRRQVGEALRESEEGHRTLVENVPIGVYRNTPGANGRFLMANPAFLHIFGFDSPEELEDVRVSDLYVEPEERKVFSDNLLAHGSVTGVELHLKRKDGTPIWVSVTARVMRDEEGQPAYFDCTLEDITARKRMEERLKQALNRLRTMESIVNRSPVMLFLWRAQPGTWPVELVSDNVEGILGYSADDFTSGRVSWPGITHPDDVPRLEAEVGRYLDEGVREWSQEYRLLTEWEDVRWVRDWNKVLTDESGEITHIQALAVDVTARKEVEEEREQLLAQIQQQARQVQQIIDTVPEGVLLLDAERRVILTNPVGEEGLSALSDGAAGEPLTRLGDRGLDELLSSPARGALWHEVEGNGRTFEVVARPMQNGGQPGNWLLVLRDVTQERQIERRARQQERLAAVGQLAAGVAHDFNNIMSTIKLYAQMMAHTEGLSPENEERLATIDDQARQATDLIQQILDFSRRAVIARQPLDLLPILKEQVRLLERTLPENIEVKMTYGPGEHTVNADPTRIQQVVTNLAVNARDAMPGGGRLHVELARVRLRPGEAPPLPEMEPGDWVRVRIADTGDGMSPEVQSHLFEPFFTTKERERGTGLGLAQVHGIVRQHEGHIDVESRVGRGTTFTIYLPALPIRLAAPRALARKDLARGQGETILVVEDDATTRQALMACLEELNYRAEAAGDGQEALEMLERVDAALVLSDVVMPRMGGIALLRALRERGSTLPLVLLTGHPLGEEIEGLEEQGLTDWLFKPPSLAQLADAVSHALT
jgi:PAS domain S-box-containing protein